MKTRKIEAIRIPAASGVGASFAFVLPDSGSEGFIRVHSIGLSLDGGAFAGATAITFACSDSKLGGFLLWKEEVTVPAAFDGIITVGRAMPSATSTSVETAKGAIPDGFVPEGARIQITSNNGSDVASFNGGIIVYERFESI